MSETKLMEFVLCGFFSSTKVNLHFTHIIMPLGLFNSQPKKTNIDLTYSSVVSQIKQRNADSSYSLNIEDFIEQEKIDLGQHQGNPINIIKNIKTNA